MGRVCLIFWGTDLIPVGYWKCNVEGVCPIMLLSSNTTQILCLWCTAAKFFVKAIQMLEYLSAPGHLSVNGTGGR